MAGEKERDGPVKFSLEKQETSLEQAPNLGLSKISTHCHLVGPEPNFSLGQPLPNIVHRKGHQALSISWCQIY